MTFLQMHSARQMDQNKLEEIISMQESIQNKLEEILSMQESKEKAGS